MTTFNRIGRTSLPETTRASFLQPTESTKSAEEHMGSTNSNEEHTGRSIVDERPSQGT